MKKIWGCILDNNLNVSSFNMISSVMGRSKKRKIKGQPGQCRDSWNGLTFDHLFILDTRGVYTTSAFLGSFSHGEPNGSLTQVYIIPIPKFQSSINFTPACRTFCYSLRRHIRLNNAQSHTIKRSNRRKNQKDPIQVNCIQSNAHQVADRGTH